MTVLWYNWCETWLATHFFKFDARLWLMKCFNFRIFILFQKCVNSTQTNLYTFDRFRKRVHSKSNQTDLQTPSRTSVASLIWDHQRKRSSWSKTTNSWWKKLKVGGGVDGVVYPRTNTKIWQHTWSSIFWLKNNWCIPHMDVYTSREKEWEKTMW